MSSRSEQRQFRNVLRGLRAADSAWMRLHDRRYRMTRRLALAATDLTGTALLVVGAANSHALVVFAGVLAVFVGLTAHLS